MVESFYDRLAIDLRKACAKINNIITLHRDVVH